MSCEITPQLKWKLDRLLTSDNDTIFSRFYMRNGPEQIYEAARDC